MKKILSILIAIGVIFAMVSCDDGGGGGSGSSKIKVTFNFNYPAGAAGAGASPVKVFNLDKNQALGAEFFAEVQAPAIASTDTYECDFKGWFEAATGGTAVSINAASSWTKETTYYAQWTFKQLVAPGQPISITYNLQGLPAAAIPNGTGTSGTAVGAGLLPTPTIPPNDDYTFTWLGWTATEGGTTLVTATDTFNYHPTFYAVYNQALILTGAELVSIRNSNYVVYKFELPAGKQWSDYVNITVDYAGDEDFLNGVARAIRLFGNLKLEHIELLVLDNGKKFGVANYTKIGNNPFIMNQLFSSWDAGSVKTAIQNITGETAKPNTWYTFTHPIDGTGANATFDTNNIPAASAEGPFYFGLGVPGQENVNTFYMRKVTLVGAAGVDDVIAEPLIVKDQEDNIFPVFVGYGNLDGSAGEKEAERKWANNDPYVANDIILRLPPIPGGAVNLGIDGINTDKIEWEISGSSAIEELKKIELLELQMMSAPAAAATIDFYDGTETKTFNVFDTSGNAESNVEINVELGVQIVTIDVIAMFDADYDDFFGDATEVTITINYTGIADLDIKKAWYTQIIPPPEHPGAKSVSLGGFTWDNSNNQKGWDSLTNGGSATLAEFVFAKYLVIELEDAYASDGGSVGDEGDWKRTGFEIVWKNDKNSWSGKQLINWSSVENLAGVTYEADGSSYGYDGAAVLVFELSQVLTDYSQYTAGVKFAGILIQYYGADSGTPADFIKSAKLIIEAE